MLTDLPQTITVAHWSDLVVQTHGFSPRSTYVEVCWLPVIGPSATWLYRRLGSWMETDPTPLEIDLLDLAVSLGMGKGLGRNCLLSRTLHRLDSFDVIDRSATTIYVRSALAPLTERQVRRLSESVQAFHRQTMEERKVWA